MGNYCSSISKNKDNISEKSEESPSYQLVNKNKHKSDDKEAPLADPEPTSDISNNPNATYIISNTADLTICTTGGGDNNKAPSRILQNLHLDSISSSPVTVHPPTGIPNVSTQFLPQNLSSLSGGVATNRRTEKDRKIVLYILAADDGHKVEKSILHDLIKELQQQYASREFEIIISDLHEVCDKNFLDATCWINEPLEAKGGHHLAANCLAEIIRHSTLSYIIPIVFLGTTLGSPLLPLTIENHDFVSVLAKIEDKELLEKWYILDDTAQRYRLRTSDIITTTETSNELEKLLQSLLTAFTKEMRDSYLTTVVEQEINNTVHVSQDLLKRCIWIQTGSAPAKSIENGTVLEIEMNRRLNNVHADLKNQIPEKNLIRIPPTVQLQNDQLSLILESLICNGIESIIDEHKNKYQIPSCTHGVDRRLLEEIEAVNQHTTLLAQNCAANFDVMDEIKKYLTTPSSEPLIIFSKSGCGKSVLAAKVAQNIHTWLPDCNFILRYTNLTLLSSEILSIVGLIAEQISYLVKTAAYVGPHDIAAYTETIKQCFNLVNNPIVLLIDSLDTAQNVENCLDWIPIKLMDHVKIVISVSSEADAIETISEQNDFLLNYFKEKIALNNFIHLNEMSTEQWKDVLSVGSGEIQAVNSAAIILPESYERSPMQAKILGWLVRMGITDIQEYDLNNLCDKMFETLEAKFSSQVVSFIVSLIIAAKDGMQETELIYLLTESKLVEADSPAKLWQNFCWIMGPMLLHTNHIKLQDKTIITYARTRYEKQLHSAHEILYGFYEKQDSKIQDKRGKYECYNKRKIIELPYHAFLKDVIGQQSTNTTTITTTNQLLSDLSWIYHKINATGCVQMLNDIYQIENYENSTPETSINKHVKFIKQFITINIRPLNYDGRQFYSLMPKFLSNELENVESGLSKDAEVTQKWLDHFKQIPIPYLELLNNVNEQETDNIENGIGYDVIENLGGQGYFVASLSTSRGEICVWDVPRCLKVRTLKGISQPTAICPVGDYGAAVLCCREIKVLDLNEGVFKVTLKGVMNQKMPYFGLHDAQHLVCLSRNRMYVNLMNLDSGDCITTFKAGEDRFLNSLLVSGDGRILVCGDETQKPFPLLVWHLSQRKLLYDLRIPHHDFVTSLSAITHEGSYVSVVAKELNEPTPNFIVVYDLQSGTLFKKWKPSCNTVSLAISQTNTCVIAGLEDARILIWDLVTGNCKYTLNGHNAPVTLLKLDPLGKVLLSADKEGRDLSVRLWQLDTGKALAVYTPSIKITTCEILPNGKYIVLAFENSLKLVTLKLKNYQIDQNAEANAENLSDYDIIYGSKDNEAKSFQLKEDI